MTKKKSDRLLKIAEIQPTNYNFNDCKPLNPNDQKNKNKLWMEWNKILQHDTVSKDVEMWNSFDTDKNQRIRFSGNRIVWGHYDNNRESFLSQMEAQQEYYRIIQLFCHHGPVNLEFKWILLEYTVCGSLSKAHRTVENSTTRRRVDLYLKKTFPTMIEFVKTLSENS